MKKSELKSVIKECLSELTQQFPQETISKLKDIGFDVIGSDDIETNLIRRAGSNSTYVDVDNSTGKVFVGPSKLISVEEFINSLPTDEPLNEGTPFAYDVYLNGKKIDTVFASYQDEEEMRTSLINHDGYDPRIKVKLTNPKLEEMTGTGAVAGYSTPNAFSKNDEQFKKKSKKTAEQLGYKLAKEDASLPMVRRGLAEARSRYKNFKENTDFVRKPNAKVSLLCLEIKRMLKEVNFLIDIGNKLKTECEVTPNSYWKRTDEDIKQINELLKAIYKKTKGVIK